MFIRPLGLYMPPPVSLMHLSTWPFGGWLASAFGCPSFYNVNHMIIVLELKYSCILLSGRICFTFQFVEMHQQQPRVAAAPDL